MNNYEVSAHVCILTLLYVFNNLQSTILDLRFLQFIFSSPMLVEVYTTVNTC